MKKAMRSISAWLLALVMVVSGFSVFGSFGPVAANADVDNTKLVIKVTNQYGQPAAGVGFILKSSSYYPDVDLEKSDSNGTITVSILGQTSI